MKEKLINFISLLESQNEHRKEEKNIRLYSPDIKNILEIKINTTNLIIIGLKELINTNDERV
jgi:hypothetical protein